VPLRALDQLTLKGQNSHHEHKLIRLYSPQKAQPCWELSKPCMPACLFFAAIGRGREESWGWTTVYLPYF